jgi:hypothetical protein
MTPHLLLSRQENAMPRNPKSEAGGNEADNARREREKLTDEKKSGTQEKRPDEHADEAIKNESAERAANAAIAHKPAG